jgi:hypothetical protein
MRAAPIITGSALVALFSACNAILGNEGNYELVGSAGTRGGATGGTAGAAAGGKGGAAGRDDDCNGDVDCEDAECSAPAECRPAPSGTEIGYFPAGGAACPSGFTELVLHRDLQVPTQCQGCSCVNPTNLLCDSGIYRHGAYPCPSYQFDGQLYPVFNDRCTTFPGDTNLHYYSIRGTSECTPSGTPALDPPTWGESTLFCLTDRVGAGCGVGMACLPVELRDNLCSLGSGACGGDYGVDGGSWYEGFDDQRGCTECSCGLGTADCSASYIGLYSDGGCSTNPMQMGSGDEGDGCGLPFAGQSARIIGNPVAGSGSCEVNVFMTGEATPTNGRQACCAQ